MSISGVNLVAVLVAAVLTFVFGGLWYSVLVGKAWMAAHGYSEAKTKEMQRSMGPAYAISFVCWFAMAFVLALIAPHFGEGIWTTLLVGWHLWLGFSATVGLTNNLFSDKPLKVWVIDAGYQCTSVTLMAVVIGWWQ